MCDSVFLEGGVKTTNIRTRIKAKVKITNTRLKTRTTPACKFSSNMNMLRLISAKKESVITPLLPPTVNVIYCVPLVEAQLLACD